MENESKKKLYVIATIIIIIALIIISCIVIKSKNDEKYLEVAKTTLPKVEEVYLDAMSIHSDMLEDIFDFKDYLSEEQAINKVKETTYYKGFAIALDTKMSELYKDLEYLKNNTYSKNDKLSVQVKSIIVEFEEKMKSYKEVRVGYEYQEESFFERIREVQNSLNKE